MGGVLMNRVAESFDAAAVTPGLSGPQKYVLESPPVVL